MERIATPLALSIGAQDRHGARFRLLGTDGTLLYIRRDAQILGIAANGTISVTERAPDRFERLAWEDGVLLALAGDGKGGQSYVATRLAGGDEVWTHPRTQVFFLGGRLVRLPQLDDPPCDLNGDLLLSAGYGHVAVRELASGKERWRSKAEPAIQAAFLAGHVLVTARDEPALRLLDGNTGALITEQRLADDVVSLSRVGDAVVVRSFGSAALLTLAGKRKGVSLASKPLFDRWPTRERVIADGEWAVFSHDGDHAIVGTNGSVTWLSLKEGDEPEAPALLAHGLIGGTTSRGTCWVLPLDRAPTRASELAPTPLVDRSDGPVGDWIRGTVLFVGAKTMSVRLETGKNATMAALPGAEKGREIFVGEFDALGSARAARLDAPTGGTSSGAPAADAPVLTITPIAPPKTPVSARILKAVHALTEANLLEPMSEERLWTCVYVEWAELEASTPKEVFVAAHAASACTAKRGGPCPHRALAVDYQLETDVNFDGNTFGQLEEFLERASIPVEISAVNDGGITVTVTCRTFAKSIDLDDVDDSTTALAGLLTVALEKAKVAERIHRVVSKDGTNVVFLLRSDADAAPLAPLLALAGATPKKKRARARRA